jgi:polysaccharide chain length determinant protein (PEP-CTERM system associated)
MLPGKKYTVADFARILRRRLWLVLVPVAVSAAAVSMWARDLPDLYRSQSTILVVPQRISEEVVRSTITSTIEDRLPTIRQEIESRTRLESIILEFDLYPEERKAMVMEDVVGLMRDNIDINIVRNDAFEVSYTGLNPTKVMQVAERLGRLAIDQSLSYRHNLAEDTDDFLESQLVDTRRQLEEQERRLENYRRAYSGQLPNQVTSNLQQVASADTQVSAAQDAVNRNMERRLLLEKTIAELEKSTYVQGPTMVPLPGSSDLPPAGATTAQALTLAQSNLATLEARGLRTGHPDLEYARRQVRDLTQRLNQEIAAAAQGGANVPLTLSPAEATRRARLAEAQQELAEIDRQIARSREDERQARARAAEAQARLDALPTRESELVALTRDYSILEASYRSLLSRRNDARISANLELQQVGEQFNIIDPARLPERPYSPNRLQLNLMGVGIGLAFGLGLVALLEVRDRTFKSDEDLALVLGLPVLAVIPLMESEQDRLRNYWRTFAVSVSCGAVVACGTVLFVYGLFG